ncbi:MAG: hypothetical protein CR986_06850 [Ignavibacteriae bacterium]|nr:MAG: hypothetical protein CR986_06850 [Ignavibacteriota bacterium]
MKNSSFSVPVSVIIPTYNRAHLITKAIESVQNQTYKNIEIIIVDDASTDNTEEIIKKLNYKNLKYFKLGTNKGAANARNFGADKSEAEYITFLDSDDTWLPTMIEKQISILQNSNADIGAVYCGMILIDYESGNEIKRVLVPNIFYKNFSTGKYFLTPTTTTILFKKEAFKQIGCFDIIMPAHQDTELAIRFCQNYSYLRVNEYLVKILRNHDQIMGNDKNYVDAKKKILEKHYDFLSKRLSFNLSKQIANYHILTDELDIASTYIKKAISIFPYEISTIIQFLLLRLFPRLLKKMYSKKYKDIPNTSGLG